MTIMDCRPFLAVGVSFLAAVLISFSRKYPNVRESWSVIASFIKFGLILSMVPGVLAGVNYEWTLFDPARRQRRYFVCLPGVDAVDSDQFLFHRLYALQQRA